jgi:photosystem II stability/assembly factor-like uncharacterized protein
VRQLAVHRPRQRTSSLPALLATLAAVVVSLAACSSGHPSATGPTARSTTPTTTTAAPRSATSSTVAPASMTTPRLTAIAFFDPSHGYGLFVRQGPTTCTFQVGSTTDGGAAFTSLTTLTASACGQGFPVDFLAFDDHGDGFAYGSELFVTHDAGASWAQMPEPGPVLSVAALGSSIWMLVSGCPLSAGQPAQCPLRLLESGDGGRTWTAADLPNGAVVENDGEVPGQPWLLRVSAEAAYVSSVPALADPTLVAPLWYTADGGVTWEARSVPCGIGIWNIALSAAPDGTLFAVCSSQPGAGNQVKSVLRSVDEGRTWATMLGCGNTAAGLPSCADNPLSAGYLGEIDAVSDSTVFLVGDRSSLMVSRDAGASWTPVEPLIGDDSGGTSQVVFFDAADGVVLGEGPDAPTLWTTADGGTTWTSVVPDT